MLIRKLIKEKKEFKELYNGILSFFYNVNDWFFLPNKDGKSSIYGKT